MRRSRAALALVALALAQAASSIGVTAAQDITDPFGPVAEKAPAPPPPEAKPLPLKKDVTERAGEKAKQAAAEQPRQVILQQNPIRVRVNRFGRAAIPAEDENFVLFPINREMLRDLEQAKQLLKNDQPGDGLALIDRLLRENHDFFYQPNRENPVHRSIKADARKVLSELPAETLAKYELQFGHQARHELDAATASGDLGKIAAVSRQYFHTTAGFEATLLIARQYLDHGHPVAAALSLQLLHDTPEARKKLDPGLSLSLAMCWIRAGIPGRAELALDELDRKKPPIRVGDKVLPPLDDQTKAMEWLAMHAANATSSTSEVTSAWTFHGGNPSRNAQSTGGSPLLSSPRWQQPLAIEPRRDSSMLNMQRELMDPGEIDLPSETPLAVGDVALVRTPRSVVGIGLRTGKREWEYNTLESEPQYNPRQTVSNPYTGGVVTVQPAKLATRHTISSDGRLVYVVEERGNQPLVFPGMFSPWGRGGVTPTGPGSYNLLRARELDTQGKLVWEVGGEMGEDEPELAGVFFLGAPLPLNGMLYVIGESKGEISLIVLESTSGKLQWSQPLAQVDTPIAIDSFRRLHGAVPSYADGVMICPTGAGAVVAVDITQRTLIWPYAYPRNQSPNVAMMRRSGELRMTPFSQDRWNDGAAIISGGKVVVTPVDSDQLHCIDLLDGKSWKVARGDNLYLACVYKGVALVIGRDHAIGLRLDDGKQAWPPVKLAGETPGVPSGRGFQSAGHYFIPLSSAEVVKLDVAAGTIQSRTRSRGGYVPGNLISFNGDVLSLTDNSLDCYYQLDERGQWAATTLRDRPNDPDALATYGEILIDTGDLAGGIEQLDRSLALADNERVRGMLVEAHLDALRTNFDSHSAKADEIERLLTEPAHIAAFARLMAAGLEKGGQAHAAFEYYVKMCQPGIDPVSLEVVTPGELSVRRDRWVQAKIAELHKVASPEERRRMDDTISAHLASIRGGANLRALRQFVNYFGNLEIGGQARSELIRALADQGEWLEIEWHLLRQARSADPQTAASGYRQLGEAMERAGRHAEAARCYERLLAKPFVDLKVHGDWTGKEAVESLPADSPVRPFLDAKFDWPDAVVKTDVVPQALDYYGSQLDISFGREPFLRELLLELDQGRQEMLARDGLGREKFRVALQDVGRMRRYGFNSPAWARAVGHILLVQADTQVLAIDAFSLDKDSKSRVLWRQDLTEMLGDPSGSVQLRFLHVPNRRMRPQWVNQNGEPVGGIWPIGHELVCIQRGTKLLALDVLTGQVLWTRHDMRPTSEIFGDDEYVFIVPANAAEAIVLRATDGQKIGERRVPGHDRLHTYGRKVVTVAAGGGKQTARVYDAWTEQDVWQRAFAPGARMELIDGDEFAVLDPKGQFVIYSLVEDRAIVDTKLEAEPSLQDFKVFRFGDQYAVVAGRAVVARPNAPQYFAVQNYTARSNPVIKGRAHAFDRTTGKELWPSIEIGPTASLLNQAARLPFMVFAVNLTEAGGPNAGRNYTHVLCLDIRSGKLAADLKLDQSSSVVVAVGDPEKKTLEIRGSQSAAVLTFGDPK
jgi:outer membrane protein assembly factor BamB